MITTEATQQMIQSSTTSSTVIIPTSSNVTDTTVTVAQQKTSSTSSITENFESPTECTSSQQKGTLFIMFVYKCQYTLHVHVHIFVHLSSTIYRIYLVKYCTFKIATSLK